jgi:predicted secreted protein
MKKTLSTFILTLFIVTACSTAPASQRPTDTPIPPRPTPNAAELEVSLPTKIIEVVAGKDFTITVRTGLSPDQHWEIAQELDPNIVAYVWKDHVPDDPNKPEASGRDVWRFKAVSPGETTISLGYYTGMEETTQKILIFNIVVK